MARGNHRSRSPEAIDDSIAEFDPRIRSPKPIAESDRRKRSPKAIEPEEAPAPAAN
jgi:hypothetical protein